MSEHYSDEQAKAILSRAIEIDSRAPNATTDDLRVIASDVGISSASLEAALREHQTARTTSQTLAAKRASRAVVRVGLPLGVVAGALLASETWLAAMGAMGVGLVASGALVVLLGPTVTLRSFHLKNSALWGSVAVGGLLSIALLGASDPRTAGLIAAGWCVRGWITSTILGSAAVIAVRRARLDSSGPNLHLTVDTALVGTGRWKRFTTGVLSWLSRSLRRGSAFVGSHPHIDLPA